MGVNESGFCAYIGPSINRVIQQNTLYRGSRDELLPRLADTLHSYPLVAELVVNGDDLPQALVRVRTEGNILHANYMRLLKSLQK